MTPGASAKFCFPFELSIVGNLADTENLSVLDKSFDVLPKVSESMTLDKIFPFVTVDSLTFTAAPCPAKKKKALNTTEVSYEITFSKTLCSTCVIDHSRWLCIICINRLHPAFRLLTI